MSDLFWPLFYFFGFLAVVGVLSGIGLHYLGPAEPL